MQTIKNLATKAFVFLTVALFFAACRPAGVRALLEGEKRLEQGSYAQAAEQLRRAAAWLGNTNAQAFNYLGLACHAQGQLAEAEKAYHRALALNPDLSECHYNLGCLFETENRLEEAKVELVAYTLRRGSSDEGWLRLGYVQLRLSSSGSIASRSGELVAAEKSFEEALRVNPQNPVALNGLGLVRLRRNRANEAATLFSRALKEQADYSPARLNLAVTAQQNLNEPEVALRNYREYLKSKPLPPEAEEITRIANELEQRLSPPPHPLAKTGPATQTSTNLPATKPVPLEPARATPAPKPVLSNATHMAQAPPPDSNVASVNREPTTNASKANPPDTTLVAKMEAVTLPPEPVFKTAQDQVEETRPDPVSSANAPVATSSTATPVQSPKPPKRTLLQRLNPLNLFGAESRAASVAPPVSPPTDSVADSTDSSAGPSPPGPRYAYESPPPPQAGNRLEAERFFAQAARAQQEQQLTEAIREYRQAAQLDPSYYDVHYNLGLAATQAGDLPLALGAYETALAIRPDSLDARYNFALVLKQANYAVDSANELEKILSVAPREGRAHLALGNLYAQQFHDNTRARAHYLQVLESDPHNPQAEAIRYWLTAHPR